jgi:hypothetical protein
MCYSFKKYILLYLFNFQAALPIRLKGIHVRNANSLISQFLNLLRPFMKKELYEMVRYFEVAHFNIRRNQVCFHLQNYFHIEHNLYSFI